MKSPFYEFISNGIVASDESRVCPSVHHVFHIECGVYLVNQIRTELGVRPAFGVLYVEFDRLPVELIPVLLLLVHQL
jgi:hypothetical protein